MKRKLFCLMLMLLLVVCLMTVAAAEDTAALPEGCAFYARQERSADALLEYVTYNPKTECTFWLMNKTGFTAEEVREVSATILGPNTVLAADAVVRDASAQTPVYDIRVKVPAALGYFTGILRVWVNGSRYDIDTAYEGMLFKRLNYENGVWTEDTHFEHAAHCSRSGPGSSFPVNWYYGTECSAIPLTGGTLSSSDPDVVDTFPDAQYGPYSYYLEINGIGTTTLTYENGSAVYEADLIVPLPQAGWFARQDRSEETWLNRVSYDPETGTEFWLLQQDGFTYGSCQNLTLTVDVEAFGTVTPVKRDSSMADEDARYDLRVVLPAGKTFDSERPYLRLSFSSTSWAGTTLLIKQPPGLLFRSLRHENVFWFEDTSRDLQTFSGALPMTHSWIMVPYYGTQESHRPLNVEDGTLTAADPTVLKISKTDANSRDGTPYFEIRALQVGQTTVTYTCGQESYTETVTVTLPPAAFYTSRDRSENSLVSQVVGPAQLYNNELWLISEYGFTADEVSRTSAKLRFTTQSFEAVQRTDGNYDLKFTLDFDSIPVSGDEWLQVTRQESWGTFYVANIVLSPLGRGQAAYLDGRIIGFGYPVEGSDDEIDICEGGWRTGNSYGPTEDTGYGFFRELLVRAANPSDGFPVIDREMTEQLHVEHLWIEPTAGAKDTFSFSPDSCVQELTGADLPLDVRTYVNANTQGGAMLWAAFRTEVDGETVYAKASVPMFQEIIAATVVERPADDTVEKLNADLAEMAQKLTYGAYYDIILAPEYHGVIEIPAGFEEARTQLHILGHAEAGTRLYGAMELDHVTVSLLRDIHFIADEQQTIGFYGGSCLNMVGCTFQNYDIAMDANVGMVTLTAGNVFVGNEIAVRLDLENVFLGQNRNPWENNTFINNGTAVQILSFSDWVHPAAMRIYDSNFFGNGVDFDVQADATLYFYRNYYADWNRSRKELNLNALANANTHSAVFRCLTPRSPVQAATQAAVTIHTNPLWFYPVQNWWSCSAKITDIFGEDYDCIANARSAVLMTEDAPADGGTEEEPYVNYLTADPSNPVAILGSMAETLQLDAAFFSAEGEKVIDVLNDQEQLIGTWTFDDPAEAKLQEEAAPAVFNPYLNAVWNESSLTVTVKDSVILAEEVPLLTISCGDVDWNCVQVIGPDEQPIFVQWDDDANTVSFPVSAGGSYRITNAELMVSAHNAAAKTVTVVSQLHDQSAQVVVASYDADGRFLGLTLGTENRKLPYEQAARTIKIFLVDGQSTMLPEVPCQQYAVAE